MALMTKKNVLVLADLLSDKTEGSHPKSIGEYRWSEKNESATFVTYSPDGVRVIVVVSLFEDGTAALGFFSSETLSELNRFENISHFDYRRGQIREMVKDIEWVWKTVDKYKASWEEEH
jgi:hypothetical protein